MQKNRTWILAALGMLLLILDTKTAIIGAKEAISYCLLTVIPSLFPFFMLSILLTSSLSGNSTKLFMPLSRLLRIPKGSESIFLIGLLGGYPTGAQVIADHYQRGTLTKQQARRMLGFCSNAGPAFLFGMIGPCFQNNLATWVLWGIHILSAVVTGILLAGGTRTQIAPCERKSISINTAYNRSLGITARVCGWIVLFRVIVAYLQRWILWVFPETVQYGVIGVLELANGCSSLPQIKNESVRFILCSGILSFGGLCVAMQTASVTAPVGMGMYLPGKCLQAVLSLCIASIAQNFLMPRQIPQNISNILMLLLLIVTLCIIFVTRWKKRIAFCKHIVYNKANSSQEAALCCSEREFKSPAHIAPMP